MDNQQFPNQNNNPNQWNNFSNQPNNSNGNNTQPIQNIGQFNNYGNPQTQQVQQFTQQNQPNQQYPNNNQQPIVNRKVEQYGWQQGQTFSQNNMQDGYQRDAISNQQQVIDYTQNAQNNGKKPKQKKPKKKKKHGFLRFLLKVAIIVLVIVAVKKGCNYWAEQEMKKFDTIFPFEFAENNSMIYVTDDFNLKTNYEVGSKNYDVKWTSSSKLVKIDKDGQVKITTPSKANVTITLKETHKKLFGKATRNYNITLVTSNSLNESDFNVVEVEDVKNGQYNENMEMRISDDGHIDYMYGDFKQTYIYKPEDAITFVNAYKSNLGISEEITFEVEQTNATNNFISYTLRGYYQDMKLQNSTVQLTVNKNNFKLTKISNFVYDDLSNIETTKTKIDEFEILDNLFKEIYNEEKKYIPYVEGDVVYQNTLCEKINVFLMEGTEYAVYISYSTGEVIDYRITSSSLGSEFDVTCSGTDELGNKIEFDCLETINPISTSYQLKDNQRNIETVDNEGFYACYRESMKDNKANDLKLYKLPVYAIGIIEAYLSDDINFAIKSNTKEYTNNHAEIAAHKYIENAYDYYVRTFNRYSYDGNNAPILVLTNSTDKYDNASWCGGTQLFTVNAAKNYKYTVAREEVLGHEYTHAVFGNFVAESSVVTKDIGGINEGYADIFGCLISNSTDWRIGYNEDKDGNITYIRDLKNYNADYLGHKFSETYKDKYWSYNDGEEHIICVLIGHIGYEMYENTSFTNDDIAKIFYESLSFGYSQSSTMMDARKNIIQAMESLGYSDAQIDFIAYQFDLEEIYDDSYEYKTEEYIDMKLIADKASYGTVFKTKNQAVEGDIMLDDTTEREYLIFYSPLGIIFNGTPVYIYEENVNASEEDIARIEETLSVSFSDYINTMYGEYLEVVGIKNLKINVEYKQYPKFAIDMCKKYIVDSENQIRDMSYSQLGLEYGESDEVDAIMNFTFKLGLTWRSVTSTPYDFYSSF